MNLKYTYNGYTFTCRAFDGLFRWSDAAFVQFRSGKDVDIICIWKIFLKNQN